MTNNTVFGVAYISMMIGYTVCAFWATWRHNKQTAEGFANAVLALSTLVGWYTVLAWINGGF